METPGLSETNHFLSYLSSKTKPLQSITRAQLSNAMTWAAEFLFASALFGMNPTICFISGAVGLLYPDDGLRKAINDFFHKLFTHQNRKPLIATVSTTAWLTWLAPHAVPPLLSAIYMISLGCRIRSYINDSFKANPHKVTPNVLAVTPS